jgi:quercetin dioxygenase-like cupin family protein
VKVKASSAGVALAFVAIAAAATAQDAGFKRTILQQRDISAPGREAVTGVTEIQPGASAPRHTHPGEEIGYVLEGTVVVEQDGSAPLTVNAGQAFLVPAGTVHGATNHTSRPVRILATYIVEKGKPLATPAAAR